MAPVRGVLARLGVLLALVCASWSLLPPPDISNISFTAQSEVCADNRAFLALFVVVSHPVNVLRRHVIRDTYPAEEVAALGIRRVFALANFGLVSEKPYYDYVYVDASGTELEDETDVFDDIIQMNSTEEYKKLVYKSLASLTWAASHCPKAKFIVKTDDDTIMDYYGAAAFLKSIPDEDVDSLNGPLYPNEKPNRDLDNWKHYTSPEEYPGEFYPNFLGGSFYATSPKTMKLLLETAKTVNFLNSEDVFFTGLVAEKAGVKLVDSFNATGSVDYSLNCCSSEEGEVYHCQYFLSLQGLQYNPLSRVDAEKFKARFQYCLTHHCEEYWVGVEAAKNLTCF